MSVGMLAFALYAMLFRLHFTWPLQTRPKPHCPGERKACMQVLALYVLVLLWFSRLIPCRFNRILMVSHMNGTLSVVGTSYVLVLHWLVN